MSSRPLRALGLLCALGASTASTCDSNVGDGDTRPRETVRISQRADGAEGSGVAENPAISADGRFVVFDSTSEDLVVPDGNGYRDVFLKDRGTGELLNLTRMSPSITYGGVPFNFFLGHAFQAGVSGDGQTVAFLSKGSFSGPVSIPGGPSPTVVVSVLDRRTGTFRTPVPAASGVWPDRDCSDLSLSDDGRTVVFISGASNLGFANGGFVPQVYALDLSTDPATLTLVSRSTASATTVANASCSTARLSRDGSAVVFRSGAANLGASGQEHLFVGTPAGGPPRLATTISGTTTPATGLFYYPAISGDGRYVAFYSSSTDLVPTPGFPQLRLSRVDLSGAAPVAENVGGGLWVQPFPAVPESGHPFGMSDDATVAYRGGGVISPIFVQRGTGPPQAVSVSSTGVPADLMCLRPGISGDGRWAVFESAAANLVEGDHNLQTDIFVHGPLR